MLIMELELKNWLKDGKYRKLALKLLSKQDLLSSELAMKLEINRASMSRILRDLKEKNLVDTTSGNSRTVTYSITPLGKKLLEADGND